MKQYLLLETGHGRAYRVVRKGHHFEVETRLRTDRVWDPIYRVLITKEEHAEAIALRAAFRKALYFGEDFAQLGVCLALIEGKENTSSSASEFCTDIASLASAPRDSNIHFRAPGKLKEFLREETKAHAQRTLAPVTLSDYLIFRLAHPAPSKETT